MLHVRAYLRNLRDAARFLPGLVRDACEVWAEEGLGLTATARLPAPSVCVLDPALYDNAGTPSPNLGDLIIQEAVHREVRSLFPEHELTGVATHAAMGPAEARRIADAQALIVGGTNLLSSRMGPGGQWRVSHRDALRIRRAVLLGAGWGSYEGAPTWKTKLLLQLALSPGGLHSVRDAYTERRLREAGVRRVVNTSCPTLWPLLDASPASFPDSRADAALVTLTDYRQDPELDRQLLDLVTSRYRTVYCWLQGKGDRDYVTRFGEPLVYVEHSYEAFARFLRSGVRFDYVGTRLHGGIKCLVSGYRSLIVGVDNRAAEIARDVNLPYAPRHDLAKIAWWIDHGPRPEVRLDRQRIERWRSQFRQHRAVSALSGRRNAA